MQQRCISVNDLEEQKGWSAETFGPGDRANGVVNHIRKELIEVLENPTDLFEWVDIIILALDGAWRSGHTPQEIIAAYKTKMKINQGREWPDWRQFTSGEAIEHVR